MQNVIHSAKNIIKTLQHAEGLQQQGKYRESELALYRFTNELPALVEEREALLDFDSETSDVEVGEMFEIHRREAIWLRIAQAVLFPTEDFNPKTYPFLNTPAIRAECLSDLREIITHPKLEEWHQTIPQRRFLLHKLYNSANTIAGFDRHSISLTPDFKIIYSDSQS